MPRESRGSLLSQLIRLPGLSAFSGLSDAQLLDRFAQHHDEQAFEVLLCRYGPMVLGVCRRLLHQAHDADDAFQATFLVLVRRANSIGRRELLANWLYGVAYKVACRLRAAHWHRTIDAVAEPTASPGGGLAADEQAILHEEVYRLPLKYRQPVVLCYFEGLSNEAAAHRLGWPAGTVSGRLARARQLLRVRLTRRGLALAATGVAAQLTLPAVSATVPAVLWRATVQAATSLALGQGISAGVGAASVVILAEGVVHSMIATKIKLAAGAMLLAAVLGTGTTVLSQFVAGPSPAGPEIPLAAQAENLTPEQMDYLREYASAQVQVLARQPDANLPTVQSLVDDLVRAYARMKPSDQRRWLRNLPDLALRSQRELDPFYVRLCDKEAGKNLSHVASLVLADLLSDDVGKYLLARREVLRHGKVCVAKVAELGRSLKDDSPKRPRFLTLLEELDTAALEDEILRQIDLAHHKAAEFAKARRGTSTKMAVLYSRQGVSERVAWQRHLASKVCYFSFPRGENSYGRQTSLEFGNGEDLLQVIMYGGQKNRLRDLGPIDFASIKTAPTLASIKQWQEPQDHLPAEVGHVYLEHCYESEENSEENPNTVVKFKILAMEPGMWIILEYELLGPPRKDS